MSARDVIAINADEPQLAQLDLLVRTLRDPSRGHFDGRIWLLTTGVSREAEQLLADSGVEVFTTTLDEFDAWPFAPVVGACEILKSALAAGRPHATDRGGDDVERSLTERAMELAAAPGSRAANIEAFRAYARKHFTKFPLCRLLARGHGIGRVMLLDSDIVCQRPVAHLFDRVRPGRCLVEYEKEPLTGDSPILRSNRLAREYERARCLREGPDVHEVNVGFLCAASETLATLLDEWQQLVLASGLERLFIADGIDGWHEQDFFRLLHDTAPARFEAAGKDLVYHAAHGASAGLVEAGAADVRLRTTGERPVLVHFAGGSWKSHRAMRFLYERPRAALVPVPGLHRTVVFGAGTDAVPVLVGPATRADEVVTGLIDNAPQKRGTAFGGHLVLGPADLRLLPFDRVRIASAQTLAICRQLRSLGVDDGRIVSPVLEPANRARLDALRDRYPGRLAALVSELSPAAMDDLEALASRGAVLVALDHEVVEAAAPRVRFDYLVVEDFKASQDHGADIAAVRGVTKLVPEVLLRWLRQDDDTVLYGLTHQEPDARHVTLGESPLDVRWGASVACSALQLAFFMGCDPVCLVGAPRLQERWSSFAAAALRAARARADLAGRRIVDVTRGLTASPFEHVDVEALFTASAPVGVGTVTSP